MLHTFKSRGGSTALLAFLVKSEQEKKKKSKSELASFEKLSSTTSAKVPQRTAFRHKPVTTITSANYLPHYQCYTAQQLRSILEKANSSLSNDREKRAKEQKGDSSVALPA
jgi:hypothetical protein